MAEPRYCSLAGCVCVACAQLDDGCQSCELLHSDLVCLEKIFTILKKAANNGIITDRAVDLLVIEINEEVSGDA